MRFPQGYITANNRDVARLKHSLCGLKQAPQA